jgi:endogenous inhibitor of DNA gyrase (YacG/DUF329 family)
LSASGTPRDGGAGQGAARRCPVCGKPAVDPFLPFCSKRHADLDLHRWLSGGYSIPGSADSAEDDIGGAEANEDEGRGIGNGDETSGDIRRGRG